MNVISMWGLFDYFTGREKVNAEIGFQMQQSLDNIENCAYFQKYFTLTTYFATS